MISFFYDLLLTSKEPVYGGGGSYSKDLRLGIGSQGIFTHLPIMMGC